MELAAEALGLQFYCDKCEHFFPNLGTLWKAVCAAPGLRVVNPKVVTLLGSFIGHIAGI